MNKAEDRVRATIIRPAVREDCRVIAALFVMASEGLAEYLWSAIAQPGESPIDAGARRCLRTGVAFSFENCLIADRAGSAVGLLHLLTMDEAARGPTEPIDPALRPFLDLRDVGSLHISALIVDPRYRAAAWAPAFSTGPNSKRACCAFPGSVSSSSSTTSERCGSTDAPASARLTGARCPPRPAVPHWTGDAILLAKAVL